MGEHQKIAEKLESLRKRFFKTFWRLDRTYIGFITQLKLIAVNAYIQKENLSAREKFRYSELQRRRFSSSPYDKEKCVFTFVLLQYNHFEISREALESIESIDSFNNVKVVVVDNCSTDGARDELIRYSQNKKYISIIQNPENVGFARGNNIGYAFARNVLHSDFVVVANNEVIYPENNFLELIVNEYTREGFSILGPDIQVRQNEKTIHQNSMKTRLWMKIEAEEFLNRRKEQLKDLERNRLESPTVLGRERKYRRKISGPIILHGSIYILSPIFVRDMEIVFNEGTFLYGEEDLLATTAFARGHKMLYSPNIRVRHNVKGSTRTDNLMDYYQKSYAYHIDSTNCYLNLLDEMEKLSSAEFA